jgi:RNA polymerase sigma-70 factor (family 1)
MNQNNAPVSDDKDLVHRLRQDDEGGFTLLYQKYWPVLMRLASGFVADRDTCKEIVQELFVNLYRKRGQLKIKISLSSYLYVSLRNKIRNYIRQQSIYNKHIRVANRTNAAAISNDVEQFVNRVELEKEINACLNGMPRKCREVYLLYQQDRCPLKQIAGMLDRPVDTVEKQLRKAVLLLRARLSGREISV